MTKSYRKGCGYSYTEGFFPTIQLIEKKRGYLREIYVSQEAVNSEGYRKLLTLVPEDKIILSTKAVERLGGRGNDHVVGVFDTYRETLDPDEDHAVLVNPMDMGNLGNIARTLLAFGYKDLAIVLPAADRWNPKAVRASMGAVFSVRTEEFRSFEDYQKAYPRPTYPFILQTERKLSDVLSVPKAPLALVFGNEASGLPPALWNERSVKIEESDEVDSLNLTTAVAVGLYHFRYRVQRS